MRYYKAYGQLKDGNLFTCYQPDYMKHPIYIGKKYDALEVQDVEEDMSEEDIQFYGVRTEEEVVPFMIEGYVFNDDGCTEQDWKNMYTCPRTYSWEDREITLERLVLVECEGTPKDVDAGHGEEITFYDQTVLRIVREIPNEELWDKIHEELNKEE